MLGKSAIYPKIGDYRSSSVAITQHAHHSRPVIRAQAKELNHGGLGVAIDLWLLQGYPAGLNPGVLEALVD